MHPEVTLSIFLDSCSLLGSCFERKGKGILGLREGQGACEEGGRKEWREAPGGSDNTSSGGCLMPHKFKWVSCGHVTSSG